MSHDPMPNVKLTPAQIAELQQHIGYGAAWLGPVLVGGQGCRVTDIDGNTYLDCTSQAWTLALGYNHPEVIEAAVTQARTLAHVRAGFPTIPRLLLAKRLAELCPGRLNRVTNAPTGSLAVEAALKLAMINRPDAHRFITFYHAYHGSTLATMAASWMGTQTARLGSPGPPGHFGPGVKFLPFMQHFVRVPNAYCYRCPRRASSPDCSPECAAPLRDTIQRGVDGPVAAVLLEPIQGNGGQIPFPAAFLREVRRICDEFGILLIFDEIQTGFGRTGRMFAAELVGVTPDILVLSKSMGGGFPIAAVVADDRLKSFEPTGEDVYTFGSNPIAQAVALKVIEILERDGIPEHVARMGAILTRGLQDLQTKYPQIGDVRGPGLFIGVEMVKDPESKEAAPVEARRIVEEAWNRGVILATASALPNVIKLKPPLIIQEPEISLVLDVLADCLKVVFPRR
ncbi:MAG TPA: aspartate aminotransferase family protein [Candidatus Methylomirabilis sp.]|nr:aspartate aminotransferase family protein [Candidatus Methylomirabilis sp.]HSD52355.1 aspartate aminotransferase family protein [Candidatus Methylomirabilis sp.]